MSEATESCSNDSPSLVVCIEKNIFGWGCRFFVSDVVVSGGGHLGHLGPLHLAMTVRW